MSGSVRLGDDEGGQPRRGSRDEPASRSERLHAQGSSGMRAAFWAIIGSIVVIYLFFIALGGIDPGDATVATIIVLALAVLWLAHAWRRLITGGSSPVGDRERRGF
jgi:hypothetical protein